MAGHETAARPERPLSMGAFVRRDESRQNLFERIAPSSV